MAEKEEKRNGSTGRLLNYSDRSLGLIGWNCPAFRDSGIRKLVCQYIQYTMYASYRLQTPRKAWMWGGIRMKDTDIDAESGIGCLVESRCQEAWSEVSNTSQPEQANRGTVNGHQGILFS